MNNYVEQIVEEDNKNMTQFGDNKFVFKEEGVVAEFNGRYWGEQDSDGRCTVTDFGSIIRADISNPEYRTEPTDMTYNPKNTNGRNPDYDKLKEAKLVKVIKTTTYELIQ